MPKIAPDSSRRVIGNSTLIHGDCLQHLSELPWHSVDLALTDPPYGINHSTNYRELRETPEVIHGDGDTEMLGQVLPVLAGKLKPTGAIYCFCSPKNVDLVIPIFRSSGLSVKNLLVWSKNDWGAGDLRGSYGGSYELIVFAVKSNDHKLRGRRPDILYATRVQGRVSLHPHQKPEKLLRKLIRNSSGKGDLIVDPFMGSGSSGTAAVRLERKFWGCEIDPAYYQTACNRVEKLNAHSNGAIKNPSPISGGREI